MHRLANEEKASLLLSAVDDGIDDIDNVNSRHATSYAANNDFPIVAKHPKANQHDPMSNGHPILCFTLILSAFILGCVSGVIIMLHRVSNDFGQESPLNLTLLQAVTSVDLRIKTKLLRSIEKQNFINISRSMESENNAANKLYEQWKAYSPTLSRINKFTYDINLSKHVQSMKSSGIKLLDNKTEKELLKIDLLPTETFYLSSLVKSGQMNGNSIYYVNYGREEDFAYLFKNRVKLQDSEKSIVFMRRKQTIITETEQIRQAIYYGFGALVLFDDTENSQTKTTNDRLSFFQDFTRYMTVEERKTFVDGTINNQNHLILILTISYDDVQQIFRLLEPDSSQWLICPTEWTSKVTTLKIGGTLSTMKMNLIVRMEAIKIELPVLMSSIRGPSDSDHFIMIGFQLGATQQNRIMNAIIEAYTNQIKHGWIPKRSILFCAWSGLDYDHYSIRQWLSKNDWFVDKNLIAYLDIGNGILANSTLNLHGSPLLEKIAHLAADLVPSPLEHNHTCHHRLTTTTASNKELYHHHDVKRRDNEQHEHGVEANDEQKSACEPHKLLDEWIRASNNQIGLNKSLGIVQAIDIDSAAALFQLQYGIPSLLIEMTSQQALTNETFYVARSSSIFEQDIQPEVYIAYTQFISEIIRHLIDEPLISFNLTNYANQIDKQMIEYVAHYEKEYSSLISHIGRINEFKTTLNSLTKSIRTLQSNIDRIPKNDYFQLQSLNKKLIEFERLFISNDRLAGMNTIDKKYKHVLIGPAFGLTNTAVPFPLLSNILYGIPEDPPTELCDASKVFWSKLHDHIHSVNRILKGFDGLVETNK